MGSGSSWEDNWPCITDCGIVSVLRKGDEQSANIFTFLSAVCMAGEPH